MPRSCTKVCLGSAWTILVNFLAPFTWDSTSSTDPWALTTLMGWSFASVALASAAALSAADSLSFGFEGPLLSLPPPLEQAPRRSTTARLTAPMALARARPRRARGGCSWVCIRDPSWESIELLEAARRPRHGDTTGMRSRCDAAPAGAGGEEH